MKNLENFHRAACEWIAKAVGIQELIDNIVKICNALCVYSATYRQMCGYLMRLRLLGQEKRIGTVASGGNIEYNQICDACLQSCRNIQEEEVAVFFDYHPRKGFQYHIQDPKAGGKYNFKGNLYQNQPDGQGEAFYSNGHRFKGQFEAGLRHGKGQLQDAGEDFLQKGYWYQDAFIAQDRPIKFYPHLKVAASQQVNGCTTIENQEYEVCYDPHILGKNLVAFRVSGDSMVPIYKQGDIIVCERACDIPNLVLKKVYVIVHNNNFMLKTIQRTSAKHWLLTSENAAAHPNFEIELDDYTQLFEVKGICNHLIHIE